MKPIYTIVVIVILVALGFLFFSPSETTAPTNEDEASDTTMEESDEMMEGGNGNMIDDAKTFEITGKNFEFSQKEIRVKEGDTVRIEFSSTDGFHDWVVDEFGAATSRVQTGESVSVEFVADKAGEFEYYCSVGNHRELGMVGTLIVE